MGAKSKKWKNENAFFLDEKSGKIKFNLKCKNCYNDCKQSYKCCVDTCPYYKAIKGKELEGK